MATTGEPLLKKRRPDRTEQGWWDCATCLQSAVCSNHAADVLSSATGRSKLQSRLKDAQAAVARAERKAASLQRALKRMSRGLTSPVLLITHAGWKDGDKGWAPGRLPVSLAVPAAFLDASLATAVCAALSGVRLEMEGCSSGLFYGRDVTLPEKLIGAIPPRPTQEMRPGAVLIDPTRQRLFIQISRTPGLKQKQAGSCRLLGYLLQEGLDSLSFTHVPNARTSACVYCCRTNSVSIPFTDVQVQTCLDSNTGTSSAARDIGNSPRTETRLTTTKDPVK